MPAISVIVPVYNVEKYLEQCINSLISQRFRDLEIILIDDGSPDQSGKICDIFAQKDKRITVIHKKNGGVAKARNDGLSIATGEYVIFVDSDDWVPDDAYQILYEKAKKTNADIVIGDVYQVIGNKEKYCRFYYDEFITEDPNFIYELIKADLYNSYCPNPPKCGHAFGYGGPWNKLVRRDLLVSSGIKFDPSVKGIFDDIIYTAYILASSKKICYLPHSVYFYRILGNSITRSYKPDIIEINNAIFKSWNKFFAEYNLFEVLEKPYYANVIRRFIDSINAFYFNERNKENKNFIFSNIRKELECAPYFEACRKVERYKLSKYHRVICSLMKINSPLLLYIVYKGKNFIKSTIR